nr:MAG TPA: hypothetical protein [Caudoviricetes sp.]
MRVPCHFADLFHFVFSMLLNFYTAKYSVIYVCI